MTKARRFCLKACRYWHRAVLKFLKREAEIIYVGSLASLKIPAPKAPVRYRWGNQDDVLSMGKGLDYDDRARGYSLQRLRNGDKLIVGEIQEEIVFYSWVCFGAMQVKEGVFVEVDPAFAFRYKVFTKADWRGHRISPGVYTFLREPAQEMGIERVGGMISVLNLPSRIATESIGLREVGRWRIKYTSGGRASVYRPNRGARKFLEGKVDLV